MYTEHPNLTSSEIHAIRDFNTSNPGSLAVSYSARKHVFVLVDTLGRVIDSSPEVWDLLDSAATHEQNRADCWRGRVAA